MDTRPRFSGKLRIAFWLLTLLGALLLVLSPSPAGAATHKVMVLTVNGPIVPVMASYIDRGISQAEEEGVPVVIQLSTPGGLLTTTDEIVDRILQAETPVVIYVQRWAASAGTFITLSAHIAAIEPTARIGAAAVVSGEGQELPETMQRKVTEDAAARIRAIAKARGRDPVRAEKAVREAKSYDAQQAVTPDPETGLRLVDRTADNLDDLLQDINGMTVTLQSGRQVTLDTGTSIQSPAGMSWLERLLLIISDPNIAYILLSIGMLGITVEIFNPGSIFPGVIGALCLLVGFYALGVLQANWAGMALIILGFILFAADIFVTSGGLLTAGGVASMVMGAVIAFSGSAFSINWWVIAVVVGLIAAFFVVVLSAIVRSHRRPQVTGREGMIGKIAVARTPLNPRGTVLVHGELWEATLGEGSAEPGEELIVTDLKGLRVKVAKRKS